MVKNVALAVVAVLVFLLMAEVALRVVVSLLRPRHTKVDPVLGWYHTPSARSAEHIEGHVYTLSYNRHGYRSPEHDYQGRPGVKRVVFLGDSFVDGSEVGDSETFTARLQQRLHDTEVINLGVYGYGTAQELLTLEREGLRYHPDQVILATFTNDYDDNATNMSDFGPVPRYVLQNDSLVLEGTDDPGAQGNFRESNLPFLGQKFLHQHSYLYYAINHYIYQRLIARRIVGLDMAEKRRLSEEQKRALYVAIVQRMQQVCDEHGIKLTVLFVYQKATLLSNTRSPSTGVILTLTARGIRAIDLFDKLREVQIESKQSLYYEKDIHWNRYGNQRLAELLTDLVQQAK